MSRAFLILALLQAGCPEYDLNRKDEIPDDTGLSESPVDSGEPIETAVPSACDEATWAPEEIGVTDICVPPPEGGFTPIVEWEAGVGGGCLSLPVVADLDHDGMPEVVINFTDMFMSPGTLNVLRGDGSGYVWSDLFANLAYGSPPAVADVNGDGDPEIIVVREYESALMTGKGDYTTACYDSFGNELWESDHFEGLDFDWGTAPSISDMNHDGTPEIVVGRVILNFDGSTRGVGQYGRGSYGVLVLGDLVITEASVSAVTDLDLDGQEEVYVGNAAYDIDGNPVWSYPERDDAMIGVANLDYDPAGELVGITHNTVLAFDTDGSVMWGPFEIKTGNILSTPGIADLDLDGMPEIIVAGGNELVCLNHDGSVLWRHSAHDESGATGASIFDFEGDGKPDVVYVDEVEMIAFEGATGVEKFYSNEHASNTMFDYPVVADVDADSHAEILVSHNGYSSALSVYGDKDNTWMPVRKTWNQHAYGISNIEDDLSVPLQAIPNFVDTNTWHSAIATDGVAIVADVEAEFLDVCQDDCDTGLLRVTYRVRNPSTEETPAGLHVALYAVTGGVRTLLVTDVTPDAIPTGWTSGTLRFAVDAALVKGAESLWLAVDDDGTGHSFIYECAEDNNGLEWDGPFCQ